MFLHKSLVLKIITQKHTLCITINKTAQKNVNSINFLGYMPKGVFLIFLASLLLNFHTLLKWMKKQRFVNPAIHHFFACTYWEKFYSIWTKKKRKIFCLNSIISMYINHESNLSVSLSPFRWEKKWKKSKQRWAYES